MDDLTSYYIKIGVMLLFAVALSIYALFHLKAIGAFILNISDSDKLHFRLFRWAGCIATFALAAKSVIELRKMI
jgi:hypothetical protein